MGKTRPPYPAAFQQQMIELVQSGRTPAELAREFDVTAHLLRVKSRQGVAECSSSLDTDTQ